MWIELEPISIAAIFIPLAVDAEAAGGGAVAKPPSPFDPDCQGAVLGTSRKLPIIVRARRWAGEERERGEAITSVFFVVDLLISVRLRIPPFSQGPNQRTWSDPRRGAVRNSNY
jgi:hypothetical protein